MKPFNRMYDCIPYFCGTNLFSSVDVANTVEMLPLIVCWEKRWSLKCKNAYEAWLHSLCLNQNLCVHRQIGKAVCSTKYNNDISLSRLCGEIYKINGPAGGAGLVLLTHWESVKVPKYGSQLWPGSMAFVDTKLNNKPSKNWLEEERNRCEKQIYW